MVSPKQNKADITLHQETYLKIGLGPIVCPVSRILILGTLPGDVSISLQQYYADSKNLFWKILSEVYGKPVGTTYASRLKFLHSKRIALWDVLSRAERKGSKDSATKGEVPNDIASFLLNYPNLKTIVFNGEGAKKQFRRLNVQFNGRLEALPSTSGTPGKYVLQVSEKVERWKMLTKL
jgi:hypoxanthine-DNA glycosylase